MFRPFRLGLFFSSYLPCGAELGQSTALQLLTSFSSPAGSLYFCSHGAPARAPTRLLGAPLSNISGSTVLLTAGGCVTVNKELD